MNGSAGPAQGASPAARDAKRALRRRLRDQRASADARARVEAAHGFAAALKGLLEQHPQGPVLAFLPLPDEPPLVPALQEAMTDRPVLLPVTQPHRRMLWTRWLPSTRFEPSGPGGLREPVGPREPAPQDIGLVLVPALAVDMDGVRLGMGGGFYDTFLESLAPGTPTVACVFAREVLPRAAVPAEPWDARLPRALTEDGLVLLGG